MFRKAFNILVVTVVILGIVFCGKGNTQAAAGVIKIIEQKLPKLQIVATGIGYPPRRKVTLAQKRLLAQRAATVDAYRTLASTLNGISGYIIKGTGNIHVSGYVQGANISQVREFADGKVEVDLSYPVSLKGKEGGNRIILNKVVTDISKKGYPVYHVKPLKKEITEEEWLELIEKEGEL